MEETYKTGDYATRDSYRPIRRGTPDMGPVFDLVSKSPVAERETLDDSVEPQERILED